MVSLVNWPVPDPTFGLKDSGEGGLFAYMVVEWGDDIFDSNNCCVDSLATLNASDVVINDNDIFPRHSIFEDRDPDSSPLKFVAFLGTTSNSLYDEGYGYFEVKYDHLTQDGKRLYDLVTKIYGQPTILTFLDT